MILGDSRETRTKKRDDSQGYFRIGCVALDVPPQSIQTNRVTNTDEFTVLRGGSPMFTKTGQARWDVSISWKAMIDDQATDEWSRFGDMHDLRYVLAMFKAAPFVEVYNDHLKQVFAALDPSKHARMAFAMRQLRLESDPDITNALNCTLVMTLFNYSPYSKDFGFLGISAQPTDSYNSPLFKSYLDSWISANLDGKGKKHQTMDVPEPTYWTEQDSGSMKFLWRLYKPVYYSGPVPPTDLTKGHTAPSTTQSPGTAALSVRRRGDKTLTPMSKGLKGDGRWDALIRASALKYGIEPAMQKAVLTHESGGRDTQTIGGNFHKYERNIGPISKADKAQIIRQLRQSILQDGDGGLAAVNAHKQKFGLAPDLGLVQFNWDTAKGLRSGLRPVDLFNPEIAIDLQAKFIANGYQGRQRGPAWTDQTIYAYNTGNAAVFYTDDQAKRLGFTPSGAYRTAVLNLRSQFATDFTGTKSNVTTTPPSAVSPASTIDQPTSASAAVDNAKARVQQATDQGWQMDHYTEDTAFLYSQRELNLPADDEDNALSLIPTGINVVFSNNLAQIPLESFQYPTYQHIGPAGTMISLGFTSVGLYETDDESDEPQHPGIEAVNYMSHQLEEQYQRFRASWRAVSSVHRMQAVFIENQMLNMLGIKSVMMRDTFTQTVPESANLVAVSVVAAQYENVFEQLSGYKVTGLTDAYKKPFFDALRKGDFESGVSSQDLKSIDQVLRYKQADATRDKAYIAEILLNQSLVPMPQVTPPVPTGSKEKQLLNKMLLTRLAVGIDSSPTIDSSDSPDLVNLYPKWAQRIGTKPISLTELFFAEALLDQQRGDIDKTVADGIRGLLASQRAATNYKQAEDLFWNEVLSYKMTTDPLFGNQVQIITSSQKFQDIKSSVKSPALDNPDHVCYPDLGLKDMTQSPAGYFFDESRNFLLDARKALTTFQSGAAKLGSDPNIANSDPVVGNLDDFLRMLQTPQYTMASAFPTYKLFLIEEDNSGTFFAFDDFYSYASVTDIEIIRKESSSDLAIVQITNLSNLLTHRLYDDTARGKHEAKLNNFDKFISGATNTGEAVTGPAASITGFGEFGGNDYQKIGKNLAEGISSGYDQVPLHYFALQPGTKIEIRMGYSNNPDELFPVFTGTVASIEGTEIMTIEAQGYMAELMQTAQEEVGSDGHFFVSTSRFGGFRIMNDHQGGSVSGPGDTLSVMEKMIQLSPASHFGHWQVNTNQETRMMKGWTWEQKSGTILEALGADHVGPLLASSYDRSGDNILINHVINATDGKGTKLRGARDWFAESPSWYVSPSYFVGRGTKTLWEYIKDVSRRYPEYSLLVKPYGFPFGSDATLVFGHPRDFYYSRSFAYDAQVSENGANDNAADIFPDWWNSSGGAMFDIAWDKSGEVMPFLLQAFGQLTQLVDIVTKKAASSTDTSAVMTRGRLKSYINDHGPRGFDKVIQDEILKSAAFSVTSSRFLLELIINSDKLTAARNEWKAVLRAWQAHRDLVKNPRNAMLKPIRKYHYVDHLSIIHNGIRLNERINNAVSIQGKVKAVNDNIPGNYRRVLIADDVIVEPSNNINAASEGPYAQSFMKEELRKMYDGELILRGNPAIEPGDVCLLADPGTGMYGPVHVESVIHSYNQEQGFISIVKPALYISINEAAGEEFIKRVADGFMNGFVKTVLSDPYNEIMGSSPADQAAALAVPGAALLGGSFVANTATSLVSSAASTDAGAALLAGAGSTQAGALILTAAASPPAWLVAGVIALATAGGLCYLMATSQGLNKILISPLTRYGKPWIGGLQGMEISNWARLVHNKWENFKMDEIQPTIEAYRVIKGYTDGVE